MDDNGLCSFNCILAIFYIAVQIFILWYVYTKAEEYGMNGCLWLIAVFFFGVFALGVFLLLTLGADRAPRRSRERSWSGYTPRPGMYQGLPAPSSNYRFERPEPQANPDFNDDHLDKLIEEGKLSEARKYLNDMLSIGRELHDETSVRNYGQYGSRINAASMDGRGASR